MRFSLLFIFLLAASHPASADRTVIDLSGRDWGVFRDFDASWVDDDIFLPPVDVSTLPANPPGNGWDSLRGRIEKTVHLPATIEERFTDARDPNAP